MFRERCRFIGIEWKGCLKMETRMKKYRQVSPERAKVWTEKSPKYHQFREVPVIYYLCKNRQLEHPHFMEIPIFSPDGLYLRGLICNSNSSYWNFIFYLFIFINCIILYFNNIWHGNSDSFFFNCRCDSEA